MRNLLLRFLVIVSLLFCISCKPPINNQFKVNNQIERNHNIKVILITIDGARWQDVLVGTDPALYDGKAIASRDVLPNTYNYMVDYGMVVGQQSLMIASNSSHVSLPGYLEIMRGYTTYDCHNNDCQLEYLTTTISDYFSDSAVFSSWDKIREVVSNNSDQMVVNCGRSYRSTGWTNKSIFDDQSFDSGDFKYDPLYRPDVLTQKVALDYFHNFHPSFMWVALGDTDEQAHMGNYEKYVAALQSADSFLGSLMQDPKSGQYVIIMTVDHGRSSDWRSHGRDEESARVWLMMRGPGIPENYQAHYNSTMTLANIFPTIVGLIRNEKFGNSLLIR